MPYAFKVCRIEPENNVHEILKAFSQLPKHTIVIIGNWQNSAYGKSLRQQFSPYSNIIMLDPIYNQKTLDMIRGNALVYIHGHSAGGTNPSLVEAMFLELPVVAYGVSYNKTTTEGKAIYFRNASELKKIIETVKIKQLKSLSATMKEIASRRYTWKVIADKYNYYIKEVLQLSKKEMVRPRLAKVNESTLLKHNAGHLKHQNLFFEKEF